MKYTAAADVQSGLKILDTRPDIMFAFVPLEPSEELNRFIETVRSAQKTQIFYSNVNAADVDAYHQIIPEEISPFTYIENPANQRFKDNFGVEMDRPYRASLSNKALFNARSGNVISFSGHRPMSVDLVVIQTDFEKAVTPKEHRDGSEFIINLYAEGSGIHYKPDPDGAAAKLKSPVITMHRGTQHKFGYDGAILHRGQEQNGACLSVSCLLSSPEAV